MTERERRGMLVTEIVAKRVKIDAAAIDNDEMAVLFVNRALIARFPLNAASRGERKSRSIVRIGRDPT